LFLAAMFATVAVVASTGGQADAAQCGDGSGGFESWKREFDEEATTKGVGATAVAALMQANYASATIAADRSQRSFGLSLDQFLAKRGALLTHWDISRHCGRTALCPAHIAGYC
jgi:membrane-bound lytic murein transglycosylase B